MKQYLLEKDGSNQNVSKIDLFKNGNFSLDTRLDVFLIQRTQNTHDFSIKGHGAG